MACTTREGCWIPVESHKLDDPGSIPGPASKGINMAKENIGGLQKITYFRKVKKPSLRQYLYRRHVQETMEQVKGETGVGVVPDTKKNAPISVIKAKELLKGHTGDVLMALHPDWVEDYEKEYGG